MGDQQYGIIAAGPWVKRSGMLRCRVVLRVKYTQDGAPGEFVVHVEASNPDGTHNSFAHGSYFPMRTTARTECMTMFEKALACWQKRVAEKCSDLDYSALFPAPQAAPTE